MKPKFAVVLVTAPNLKIARTLARASLNARLAACVNLIPSLESHYWWQDRLESGREILLLVKTTHELLPALERRILESHPYDTPEFLVLSVARGNRRYLTWINQSVHSTRQAKASPVVQERPGIRRSGTSRSARAFPSVRKLSVARLASLKQSATKAE